MNLNDRLQLRNIELYTQDKYREKIKILEEKEYKLIKKIENLKLELRGVRVWISKYKKEIE